jgi:hypothetical protein
MASTIIAHPAHESTPEYVWRGRGLFETFKEELEYLGRRNPERFPTIGEYEEALRRYPAPVWASGGEVHRAEVEDQAAFDAAAAASHLSRSELAAPTDPE